MGPVVCFTMKVSLEKRTLISESNKSEFSFFVLLSASTKGNENSIRFDVERRAVVRFAIRFTTSLEKVSLLLLSFISLLCQIISKLYRSFSSFFSNYHVKLKASLKTLHFPSVPFLHFKHLLWFLCVKYLTIFPRIEQILIQQQNLLVLNLSSSSTLK